MEAIINNITVKKSDIECYRGTSYGCAIYLKDGSVVRTEKTFEQIHKIFDL